MNEFSTIIVGQGPDWVTVSATEQDAAHHLDTFAKVYTQAAEARGEISRRWAGMGYRGYQIASMRCGARNGSQSILMLSGNDALELSGDIYIGEARVTRFDLQVTVAFDRPEPGLAFAEYQLLDEKNKRSKKERALKFIRSPSGDSLYVGARTSAVMLRLYDKGRDLNEDRRGAVWRYEVEYKKNAAQLAYEEWRQSEQREVTAMALVMGEFRKRSIEPKFTLKCPATAIEVGAKSVTVDSQLDWLTKCVSPVVTKLINLGHTDRVLSALKLKHFIEKEQVSWQ